MTCAMNSNKQQNLDDSDCKVLSGFNKSSYQSESDSEIEWFFVSLLKKLDQFCKFLSTMQSMAK